MWVSVVPARPGRLPCYAVAMSPVGFRCQGAEGAYGLFVAGITAAEGLALLEPQASVRVMRFGATGYQRYGWATEQHLPALHSVAELRALVEPPGLGLLELEAQVEGFGKLTAEDDSGCVFHVPTRVALLGLMHALLPAAHAARGIHALLSNPGVYFASTEAGLVKGAEPGRKRDASE